MTHITKNPQHPLLQSIHLAGNYYAIRIGDKVSVINAKTEKTLKPYRNNGIAKYLAVSIGKTNQYMHRIAALFIPNPNNYECVNHIDNDPTNNAISNLEWVTRKDNTRHYFENFYVEGTVRPRITSAQLTTIYLMLKAGKTTKQIIEKTGVSPRYIFKIKKSKSL